MTVGRPKVQICMDVVGRGGGPVGRVVQSRDFDFVMERPGADPLVVPLIEVESIAGGRVRLRVDAEDVVNQDWASGTSFLDDAPETNPERSA